jgi:hypothetical protein
MVSNKVPGLIITPAHNKSKNIIMISVRATV